MGTGILSLANPRVWHLDTVVGQDFAGQSASRHCLFFAGREVRGLRRRWGSQSMRVKSMIFCNSLNSTGTRPKTYHRSRLRRPSAVLCRLAIGRLRPLLWLQRPGDRGTEGGGCMEGPRIHRDHLSCLRPVVGPKKRPVSECRDRFRSPPGAADRAPSGVGRPRSGVAWCPGSRRNRGDASAPSRGRRLGSG